MTQELKNVCWVERTSYFLFIKEQDIPGVTMHLQLPYSLSYSVFMMYMKIIKNASVQNMCNKLAQERVLGMNFAYSICFYSKFIHFEKFHVRNSGQESFEEQVLIILE